MNKFMVIVLGQQFVKPMFIFSNGDKGLLMLKDESKNNPHFVYCIYKYYEKQDQYYQHYVLRNGVFTDLFDNHVQGVRIDG